MAAPATAAPRSGSYIVTLRSGVAGPVARIAASLASAHGGRVGHVYTTALRGFEISLPSAAAAALSRSPLVSRIERNGRVRAFATQNNPPYGLDRIDQRDLPLSATYVYNATGAGVTAYIIDTGIRPTHVDFGGRASIGTDTVGDGQNGNDCNGHGTHVAGTVGSTTYGVAKAVSLVGVRVLDCGGEGTYADVIAGVDWVTANAVKPAVANMSLGGGPSSTLDDAVRNSINSGVQYSLAAGNGDLNGNAVDACGTSPARTAEALTVSATNSSDQRASFANYGSCVDLFAPGVSVLSTWNSSNTATATLSGTSMAAPHVAGIMALYLQTNPSAAAATVASAIVNATTLNKVPNPNGSPNRLAYMGGFTIGMSATPNPVNFGSVGTGTSSAPQTVTVTNGGSTSVNVTTTTVGGTNPGDFSLSNNTCAGATVTAGGSCAFDVTFAPAAGGARAGTVGVAHSAIGSPLVVALTGSGVVPTPGIAVTPASIAFGNVVTGGQSTVQNVTVSSTGSGSLALGTFSITGTNANQFSIVSNTCGATLAPGGTCVAGLRFAPTTDGSKSATLNIPSDAGTRTVGLSGTGTPPALVASPTSVDFGDISTTAVSTTRTVSIRNTTFFGVQIGTVTLGGADASQFQKVSDSCSNSTLFGSGSCSIGLRFAPTTTGPKVAAMSVPHNGAGSPLTVPLAGNGTGGGGGGGSPAVGLNTTSLAFGSITVGSTSASQNVVVTNTGAANLVIGTVTVTGTNASEFTKPTDTCSGATLAPSGTCQLAGRFAPATAGTKTAALSIPSNAAGSPHQVALSGTGVTGGGGTPAISLPSSMNFGFVFRPGSSTQVLTIRSTGTANLVLGTLTLTGASDFTIVSNFCSGATLAPGATCNVSIRFAPATSGSKNATLTVPSNAAGSPHTVAISGQGF